MLELTDFQRKTAAFFPEIELRFAEPMSRHTSFRIGGAAEVMAFPKSEEELAKILHRGYCWKQKSNQIAAAFILPEGFVLGVSIVKDKNTAEPTKLLEELSLAVKDFKSHVWQSNGV